jgi:hypothetical protein
MQTYEMLMATPLSPSRILWGKLVSSLTYVFLLLFAAIPFASLVYIFGGVAIRDMVKAVIVLMAIAVLVGVIGIFLSSLLGHTSRSTVVSYLVIAGLIFLPVFFSIIYSMVKQVQPPRWVWVLNPLGALRSAIQPSLASGSPLDSIFYSLGLGYMLDSSTISSVGIPRPLYHYSLPAFGALALVLYMLATRLVQPIRRWRLHWRTIVAGLVLVGAFSGAVYGAFAMTSDTYGSENIFAVPTPFPAPMDKGAFIAPAVEVTVEKAVVLEEVGDGTESALSVDTQVEIYTRVIESLVQGTAETIYLLRTTDDAVGDPNTPTFEPQVLDIALQEGVVQKFAEQAVAKVVWVDTREEIFIDETSVLVTLGTIQIKETGEVWVPGSVEGSAGSRGLTHVLSNGKEGIWAVAGDTGVVWEK